MATYGADFASVYWHRNAGIDFTQAALGDPAVQLEDQRRRKRHIVARWESLGLRVEDAQKREVDTVAPLVNGYGVATISMIFGCKGVFTESLDPYAEPLNLSDGAISALTPQTDFSDNPVMQDLEAQAAWLVKTQGRAKISINVQSVPNLAFKLRGDQLMMDFYDNPELVHTLLTYLQQSWINVQDYIGRVNERNGCPDSSSMSCLGNCTVALVSPDIYRDFFLPYDQLLTAHYGGNYGVHHCGANMHRFARDYARLGEGVWFDIGYGSDVKSCMELLKTGDKKPYWSVRYGPAMLRSGHPGDIRREREALEACGADTVLCIGVDPDTPDENLKALLVP